MGAHRDALTVAAWAFTAFMAVLLPVYLVRYGPTNFLYFCDISLFLALLSLWTRWRLPASMAAVGLLVPQTCCPRHRRPRMIRACR